MTEREVFLIDVTDAAKLKALEEKSWDVGDESARGVRRMSKSFRDDQAIELELKSVLGPETHVAYLTAGPDIGDVLGKVLDQGRAPTGPIAVVQPQDGTRRRHRKLRTLTLAAQAVTTQTGRASRPTNPGRRHPRRTSWLRFSTKAWAR
jgi:hypothetical protein